MTIDDLEDTINRQTYGPLGHLMSRQTFWVFVAAVIAFIYVSFASHCVLHARQPLQRFPQLRLRRHHRLGMTAVIITGGIDLSVGSVLCLTGMVTGMMMAAGLFDLARAARRRLARRSLCGGVSGVLIAYVGMPPFVVTLGMMSLARSVAMVMSNNTMVFDFGRDHAKFIGLGGGSTRGWFEQLADWVGPDIRARRRCDVARRRTSTSPIRRSSSSSSRCSSASPSAGRDGAGTSSPSAATSRRRR